jgi:hypothetical protein
MNDSTLSTAVVSRVLQVTRQSWAKTPDSSALERTPPTHKLSSHRLALQSAARRKHQPWGLPSKPALARSLQV